MSKMRLWREAKKMTLQRVAEVADLAMSTVTDAESGSQNPRIHTAQKIAAAMGATMNDIWSTGHSKDRSASG